MITKEISMNRRRTQSLNSYPVVCGAKGEDHWISSAFLSFSYSCSEVLSVAVHSIDYESSGLRYNIDFFLAFFGGFIWFMVIVFASAMLRWVGCKCLGVGIPTSLSFVTYSPASGIKRWL